MASRDEIEAGARVLDPDAFSGDGYLPESTARSAREEAIDMSGAILRAAEQVRELHRKHTMVYPRKLTPMPTLAEMIEAMEAQVGKLSPRERGIVESAWRTVYGKDDPGAGSNERDQRAALLQRHGIRPESVLTEDLTLSQENGMVSVRGTIDVIGVHPKGVRLPSADDAKPRTRITINDRLTEKFNVD